MNELTNIYLDGSYKDKNPTWHIEDSENKAKVILEAITRASIKPKSVMEIGCGAGEILNVLHKEMADSVSFKGYEISPQAYEFCKAREKERLTFLNEDALSFNSYDKYDAVLCIDVFEHVENYIDFIRKLKMLGEYKIFRIPLDLSAKSVVKNSYWNSRETYGHLHYFTKELILRVLNDLDYTVIDCFFDTISIQEKPKSLKSYFLRLINKLAYKVNQDFAARTFGGYFLVVTAK